MKALSRLHPPLPIRLFGYLPGESPLPATLDILTNGHVKCKKHEQSFRLTKPTDQRRPRDEYLYVYLSALLLAGN
jgi:hypothetical protein